MHRVNVEYESRAGVWRLARLLDDYQVKCTCFVAARAVERNPEVSAYIQEGWTRAVFAWLAVGRAMAVNASSGEHTRHRLSRAGNRRLNHVLNMAGIAGSATTPRPGLLPAETPAVQDFDRSHARRPPEPRRAGGSRHTATTRRRCQRGAPHRRTTLTPTSVGASSRLPDPL